jgi:hypothetical protein
MGVEMIKPFMTQAEKNAARQKSITSHISILENRYPKQMRKEAVTNLKKLLRKIPEE